MAFQQGLSGLNAAAKQLDVIGNNIANSSTVGFKGSTTEFADVYARSLNGAGAVTAGIGVSVPAIAQQFSQGAIETTANPLDIAINGAGYFRTEAGGAVQYTRNGQFSLDKNGFVVNAEGAKLTGYGVDKNDKVLASSPEPIQISTQDMKPVATTRVSTSLNLDSRAKTPTNYPFNASDATTYNHQTPVSVYDTLGNQHTLSLYYVKSDSGTWDVYAGSDGTELTAAKVDSAAEDDATSVDARSKWTVATQASPADAGAVASALNDYSSAATAAVVAAATAAGASDATIAAIQKAGADAAATPGYTPDQVDADIAAAVKVPAQKVGTLKFDANGALSQAQMAALDPPTTLPLPVAFPVFPATGAKEIVPIDVAFTGSTQYGADTSEKLTTQDGYTAGHLQRFSTAQDGTIVGQYSNGQTKALGQVVLANFTNSNGLEPIGNNAWVETASSGTPIVGTPGSGSFGVLQSSATESSNVDLTAELVNMITAQRYYQANAQTIKTQDSVLQTLVNLR
jgi:flagellar hook protein FlgE